MKIIKTKAYKLNKEVEDFVSESMNIKDCEIKPVKILCDDTEFLKILKTKAKNRKGFHLGVNDIDIGHLFCKMEGVFSKDLFQSVRYKSNFFTFDNLIKYEDVNGGLLPKNILLNDGFGIRINVKRCINLDNDILNNYPVNVRRNYLKAINRVLNRLDNLNRAVKLTSKEIIYFYLNDCGNILKILNSYDLVEDVPLLVVSKDLESTNPKDFSERVLLALLLADELAFDIIVFSEKGLINIENFLKDGYLVFEDAVLKVKEGLVQKIWGFFGYTSVFVLVVLFFQIYLLC